MFGLKTEVSNLLKVQEIDSAIDKNKALLANASEKTSLAQLKSEVADLNKLKTRLQENYAEEKKVLSKQNDELDSLTAKIKKEEQKLYAGTIGNPKELASIQQEITSLNNRRDVLETAALEQMEKVSNTQRKISVVESKLSEQNTKLEGLQSSLTQKEKEIAAILNDLQGQRQEVEKTIEPELLSDYEDTRQRKDGIGAAALIDGICQACHVTLSETELEETNDQPDYCPSCGRILIVISE